MADIQLVQGDTAPDLEATLRNVDDDPMDLTEADSVRFQMRRVDSKAYAIDADATIVTPASGAVRYVLQQGDLAQWGDFYAQWEIHWSDGTIQTTTPPNTVEVRRQ